MSERDEAVHVATVILEGKNFGPGGRSLLAREFLRAMEERAWLPIKSAPRDGTLVLGWVRAIRGRHTLIRFVGGSDWPWATATGRDRGPYKEMQVSHWMPLPEPPEEKSDV